MIRFYVAALFSAAIFLSYFVGVHVANIRCRERISNANVEQIMMHAEITENTNDTVLHTGVGDIRRILYEKYTIAE